MLKLIFRLIVSSFFLQLSFSAFAENQPKPLRIGIAGIFSGDFANAGTHFSEVIDTYKRHYLRHPIDFVFEDARISSSDGLKAFQKLISLDSVDLIMSEVTSNGLVASKQIINESKTPVISLSTGGCSTDKAGPWIFRLGHSDILNGVQEAEYFIKNNLTRVAVLAEETEYTQDIAVSFLEKFESAKLHPVYKNNFLPGTSDFKSFIAVIKEKDPQAILMLSQTGTAFALFLKQWHELHGDANVQIHTSFVAALNEDARKIAGDLLKGVYYMAPSIQFQDPRFQNLLVDFRADHGHDPLIPFRSASIVDALDIVQMYIDKHPHYTKEGFRHFLEHDVNGYKGLVGHYFFDIEGNVELGFTMRRIEIEGP